MPCHNYAVGMLATVIGCLDYPASNRVLGENWKPESLITCKNGRLDKRSTD